MSKEYTPFYDGLEEKYKEYYMEWSKEVLIDHMVANIHNADVLLKRIEDAEDFIDRYLALDLEQFPTDSLLNKLRKILKGENK